MAILGSEESGRSKEDWCMDRPPNKMVILERWSLVEVLLYVIFISRIYYC